MSFYPGQKVYCMQKYYDLKPYREAWVVRANDKEVRVSLTRG